jgi:hypothetical protein
MFDNGRNSALGKWISMNVKLKELAAALLEAVRAHRRAPVENILELALEALAREQHVEPEGTTPNEAQRWAVSDMLEFVKRNRVQLGAGLSVKDLLHEGHRI